MQIFLLIFFALDMRVPIHLGAGRIVDFSNLHLSFLEIRPKLEYVMSQHRKLLVLHRHAPAQQHHL